MSFVSDIDYAFRDFLNANLNIIVKRDFDNGPEPTGDYGVVGITTINKLDRDGHHFFDDPVDGFQETIRQNYDVTLTFSFYGDSCYDNAFESQALLQLRNTQEDFHYNNNISIVDVNSIQRIPELRETVYIQRATFDIICLVGFEYKATSDYFDTVNWTGEYYYE